MSKKNTATTTAAPAKATPAPKTKPEAAKKTGLRKPQLRILAALAKAKKSLTRTEISKAAGCDYAWLNAWIGSHDEAKRAKNDAAEFPCLLTLKAVKYGVPGEDGSAVYDITATGRQMLATASKDKAAK